LIAVRIVITSPATKERACMSGREAVLAAFDRLFDRAAAKLQAAVTDEDKMEAKRSFAERFAEPLGVVAEIATPPMGEEVLQGMEAAIDRVSPAQMAGYLAAIPLVHQTQAMVRAVAYRAAQQRLLEHLIQRADNTYGGN
jgi:hypothetical protein